MDRESIVKVLVDRLIYRQWLRLIKSRKVIITIFQQITSIQVLVMEVNSIITLAQIQATTIEINNHYIKIRFSIIVNREDLI